MPKIVDHEKRRAEIAKALWRVIQREGITGVSIRVVAAEAGYPKATVTYYFKTQADLLTYAMEESLRVSQEKITRILAQSPGVPEYVEALLEVIPTTPLRRRQTSIWLEVVTQSQGNADLRRYLLDVNNTVYVAICGVLEQMRAQGLVSPRRSIELEARTLHAVIDGLSLHTMTSHRATPPSQIREIATHLILQLQS